jgi:peroxiredoxin
MSMQDDHHDHHDAAAAPAPADSAPVDTAGVPPATPVTSDTEGSPPGRRRWIVAALAALGVALFAVPLLRGPVGGPSPDTRAPMATTAAGGASCSAPEGKANFDFTMKDSKGKNVRLSDYKGKVVLLNFWATWCGPCKIEIPEFVEVYTNYKDRGFEILGVLSMDEPSDDDLTSFASAHKMNYPLFRANEQFENAHGPLFALPTSFIIDRHGTICTKHLGPISREALEREIKGLL